MNKQEWIERREQVKECLDVISSYYKQTKRVSHPEAQRLADLLEMGVMIEVHDNAQSFTAMVQVRIARLDMMLNESD